MIFAYIMHHNKAHTNDAKNWNIFILKHGFRQIVSYKYKTFHLYLSKPTTSVRKILNTAFNHRNTPAIIVTTKHLTETPRMSIDCIILLT